MRILDPPLTRLWRAWTLPVLAALALAAFRLAIASADARSRGLLQNTLWLAAGAIALAVPAGAWLGLVLSRTDVYGRRIALALVLGALLVPLHLQAAAWHAGFGIEGWQTALQSGELREPWLDRWRGAIWVHGVAGISWVALFTLVAARSIPRAWEESALLDLSPAGVLCRVTLRYIAPAVVLGALWVAITTMTEMSVTDLFAIRTYAEELYIELNAGSWNALMGVGMESEGPVPTALGIIVMTMVALAGLVLAAGLIGALPSHGGQPPLVVSLGRKRWWWSAGTWLVVGVLVLVPLGSLIYKAGAHVHATQTGFAREWSLGKAASITFGSPFDHAAEFQWSLLMALCTGLLTLAVAVPLAYAAHSNRFAAIAATLLAVGALAIPGPLLSLGLISLVNDPAWPWLNYLYDRTIGVAVLAQTVRAFPLALFLVWCGLRTIPRANREAALLDGAGPFARLWLAVRQRPAAVALAGLAAAVISMGELSATILVVPPGIEPLAVRIFGLLHYNVEDQVAGITLTLIVLHAAAALVILAAGRRAFRLG